MSAAAQQSETQRFDALVVGAGFTGLYALHKLREMGLSVRVVDAGEGVGGTWFWNRYPGARTDSQAYIYQYWFSEELLEEWDWSERFPAQEETERYLNYVADKFDLRRDIQLSTRVLETEFDEGTERWRVTTDRGDVFDAQFLVMGTGGLTEPIYPEFRGARTFAGTSVHTSRWPVEDIDLRGKRVGVIGTGATGIQVIQTIAPLVEHLTVFQRTANYTIAIDNPRYDDAARAELRTQYPDLRERVHTTFAGFDYEFDPRPFLDLPVEERRAVMEQRWQEGSLSFWVGCFQELFFDQAVNDEFSDFVREKIRARIDDPDVAETLTPRGYGFGTRRVPLENQYYEAFNRDNVRLVDLRETPIERITETGVVSSGDEHALDVLIYATGFDAGTGALMAIDVRGRDGLLLRDSWGEGLRSFMGLQIHGYPNMFTVMAPMSPVAAFCNVPTCVQQQVEWIADCIGFVRDEGRRSIEPTAEAEAAWVAHHDEVANATLVPKTKSWYMGTNVEGKKPHLLVYAGGANVYKKLCDEVKERGYREFSLA